MELLKEKLLIIFAQSPILVRCLTLFWNVQNAFKITNKPLQQKYVKNATLKTNKWNINNLTKLLSDSMKNRILPLKKQTLKQLK